MPVLPTTSTFSSRTEDPLNLTAIAPPQAAILGAIIATVVFFAAIGVFLTWMLCFYRERHETCWLPKLCCGRGPKAKTRIRSFLLEDPDYALNRAARRSRILAATDLQHGIVSPMRERTSRGTGFRTTRPTRASKPNDSPELDVRFAAGDDQEGLELDNLPPRLPSPTLRSLPKNGPQSATPTSSLRDWPELPPRPAASKIRKNRESMSVLFSSKGRKEKMRRDSI